MVPRGTFIPLNAYIKKIASVKPCIKGGKSVRDRGNGGYQGDKTL